MWPPGKQHTRTTLPNGKDENTFRSQARGPGRRHRGRVLHELLERPSGHLSGRRRVRKGRKDGEDVSVPSRKAATSNRCSSTCGSGASRRRPGAGPRRHGDDLRFGPGPGHHAGQCPWQLDNRVAAAWAKKTGSTNEKELHEQIEQLLHDKSHAPLGGLVGVPLVNVLEVNLALKDHFAKAEAGGK